MNRPIEPSPDEKDQLVNLLEQVCELFVSSKHTRTQAMDEISRAVGLKSRRVVYDWMRRKKFPKDIDKAIGILRGLRDGFAQPISGPPATTGTFDMSSIIDLAIQYGEMKGVIERLRECKSPEEAMDLIEKVKKRA